MRIDYLPREAAISIAITSAFTGISLSKMFAKDRTKEVVFARNVVVLAMRSTGMSQNEIGSLIGKDRSTVLHSIRNSTQWNERKWKVASEILDAIKAEITTTFSAEGLYRKYLGLIQQKREGIRLVKFRQIEINNRKFRWEHRSKKAGGEVWADTRNDALITLWQSFRIYPKDVEIKEIKNASD